MTVFYGEFDPAPELRPLFASYWVFRAGGVLPAGFEHTVPPDGAVSLTVLPSGFVMAVGPRTEPMRPPVSAGDVVYGARLWPGAAAAVLRTDVFGLRNRALPLGDLLPGAEPGRLAAALRERPEDEEAVRRFDAVLAPLADRAQALDAAVMRAVFAILEARGQVAVSELARGAGLSERHLRRRFVRAVGLSPKELARVWRLRASLLDALASPQRRWVELAAACGYADQAHLVKEYKRLSGLAPEAY
ncbi:MAG TPA: helix-turn-helix transcriptional regulator, partial [Vicinamibacteria bacterium]|nr:helix-turn-helix transcriptional regulator [Vicinamibacteria bacterium]